MVKVECHDSLNCKGASQQVSSGVNACTNNKQKKANLFQHRFIFSCVLGGLVLIYSCTNFTEKEVEMEVSLNVCYLGKKCTTTSCRQSMKL